MNHKSTYRLYSTCSNVRENDVSCKKLFYIVLIINCLLTATFSATVYYWKYQMRPLPPQGNAVASQMFCFKCKQISVYPLDDENHLKDFERKDNGTNCCTKDPSQMKHLVHQFLERNHRLSIAKDRIIIPKCPDNTNKEKPAGRIVGVDHDRTEIDEEEIHVLRWLNTIMGSYQNHGVMFIDGQLEIRVSGYYWFSSRVTFRDTNTTLAQESFAFFHAIFRRAAEYPLREDTKLAEAKKTRCKYASEFTDRHSFIGDIAYLKKGEKVIVKVSHPDLVSQTPQDSFIEVRLY